MNPAVLPGEDRPRGRPGAVSFAFGREIRYRRILVPVGTGSASAAGVRQAIRIPAQAGARILHASTVPVRSCRSSTPRGAW
jgi:hypothetical protein